MVGRDEFRRRGSEDGGQIQLVLQSVVYTTYLVGVQCPCFLVVDIIRRCLLRG